MREFLVACQVKVLFPALQNGGGIVENSVVGVFDTHYLSDVQGRAMAAVHTFVDLVCSFRGIKLGVGVCIVPGWPCVDIVACVQQCGPRLI